MLVLPVAMRPSALWWTSPDMSAQGRTKYGKPLSACTAPLSFLQAAKCPLQEARDCQIEPTRLEPNHQTAKED
jgi:hypothetical protein